jgi:WD40 repeat protein
MSTTPRLLPASLLLAACAGLARPDEPSPEPPGPRISPANAARLRPLPGMDGDVWRVVWRPDGKQVAFVYWEKVVEVRESGSLRLLRKLGAGKKVISFAFSPDKDVMAFGENGSGAEVLNLRTGRSVRIDTGSDQPSLAFSPDGRLLATGGYGNGAKLWNPATGKLVRALDTGPVQGGLTLAFSPDAKVLAVGNRNSTTRLFDPATGKLLHILDRRMSHELKFHPSGKTLAVAYVDSSVRLWDVAGGRLLYEKKAEAEEVYTLDWSPAGDVLATAGLKTKVTLWDPKDLSVLAKLDAPEWVIRVSFTPDGTRLLAAGGSQARGGDRKVRVWEAR